MSEFEYGAATDAQLQREAQQWLVKLTSGRATTSDATDFRHWCARSEAHAQAFTQARQLWQALGPAAQQLEHNRTPASVVPLHDTSVATRRRFGRRAFITGAVAASAAFVFLRPSLFGEVSGLMADYHTTVGEQRSVMLANDVLLELNTQTRINRRVFDDGSQGIELLAGEIEVRTQAPFKMRAGTGWIRSDGGRFVVRATGPEVLVTCVGGNLSLDHRGQSMRLDSDQQLSYGEREHSSPRVVDTTVVTAWRQRLLIFEGETLAHVIDELNRYRTGRILLMNRDLGQRRVQARIRLDQLPDVAALIRDAYGAQVTELPGGVVLVS
ncbi:MULTISPECIES: FecR family protein [Pseudomonadaceae]|uniref:FecR family protein n=1 Tax=Pseudomonadaceae TaxID=135621 RepID=UPI00289E72C0|nr:MULTISPECIES: FecR domain-containing protein [Pseudomonadaceae]